MRLGGEIDYDWNQPVCDSRHPRRKANSDGLGNVSVTPRPRLSSAFKWTFFPILVFSLASLLGEYHRIAAIYVLWFVAAIYDLLALLLAFVLLLAPSLWLDRYRPAAGGIFNGVFLGMLVVFVTGFVDLLTFSIWFGS